MATSKILIFIDKYVSIFSSLFGYLIVIIFSILEKLTRFEVYCWIKRATLFIIAFLIIYTIYKKIQKKKIWLEVSIIALLVLIFLHFHYSPKFNTNDKINILITKDESVEGERLSDNVFRTLQDSNHEYRDELNVIKSQKVFRNLGYAHSEKE
jgi:hypothetical protein